ncbi:MAG: hypothetical protein P8J87_02530 [Verrucomicrobiales bacterium]|nr:hypothetical protein [Verrucomicrobiales bacterium]
MSLSSKAKVNIVVASVSSIAALILILQNLTSIEIDIFYFTIETTLAAITPAIFLLGATVGWAANSLIRRKRAKQKADKQI